MTRIILLVIWAILQVVLFCFLIFVPTHSSFMYPLTIVVGVILALVIHADDNKLTTSKLSWIIIVITVPVIGVVAYLIFGHGYMSKYRQDILQNSRLRFSEHEEETGQTAHLTDQQRALVDYLDRMKFSTTFLHNGGEIVCYTDGNEKYNQLLLDIEQATKFIHIEYFIIKPGVLYDRLADLLI